MRGRSSRGQTTNPTRSAGISFFEKLPDEQHLAGERAHRGRRRHAVEVEIARVVVLDDRDAARVRPLHERFAPRARDRRRRRVVGVGHQVEALGARPRAAIERLEIGAFVVGGNAHEARAGRGEEVDGPGVGRLVDEKGVARIEERAGDEVERLLAPRRDEDVLRRRRDPLAREVLGDEAAEPR